MLSGQTPGTGTRALLPANLIAVVLWALLLGGWTAYTLARHFGLALAAYRPQLFSPDDMPDAGIEAR